VTDSTHNSSPCIKCSTELLAANKEVMKLRTENAELRGKVPWRRGVLACWAICGMNHYHVAGQRRLFVSMTRFGNCITAEGPDGPEVWADLERAAQASLSRRPQPTNDQSTLHAEEVKL
jgi:hypothetical protein